MAKAALEFTCRPAKERYRRGEAIQLRVELVSKADLPITVLASGIPWTYHHAIKFKVLKGGKFENRLWVLEPPAVPDETIEPRGIASGEVDLAKYLYTKDGASISEMPGAYQIRARLTTLASTGDDEDYKRLEVDSEPFTIVIEF